MDNNSPSEKDINRPDGLALEDAGTGNSRQLSSSLRQMGISNWNAGDISFRKLIGYFHQVLYLIDISSEAVLYVSPAYSEVFGEEAPPGGSGLALWAAIIHPFDRDRVIKTYRNAPDRKSYNLTYRIIRPDGKVRWIRDRGHPVEEDTGAAVIIAGVIEDISDLRTVSESLESLGQKYSAVLRGESDLLIFCLQASHRIVEVNRGFERLMGYAPGEVVGKSLEELGIIPRMPDTGRIDSFFGNDGRFGDLEIVLISRSGEERECLLSGELVEINGVSHIIYIAKDISNHLVVKRSLNGLSGLSKFSTRQELYKKAVLLLAEASGSNCVFIGELDPVTGRPGEILGMCIEGREMPNVKCSLSEEVVESLRGGKAFSADSDSCSIHPGVAVIDQDKIGRLHCYPVADENGQTGAYIAAFESIPQKSPNPLSELLPIFAARLSFESKRLETEKRLRRSEEHFELAQDIAQMGSWYWDIREDRFQFSHEAKRILGINPAAFSETYEEMLNVIYRDDREEVVGKFEDILKRGNSSDRFHMELRINNRSLGFLWVESLGKVIRDRTGQPIRIFGVIRDISKRKSAEMQLSKTQSLLTAALDYSPVGIMVADAVEGEVIIANNAARTILGTKADIRNCDITEELPFNWKVFRPNGTPIPANSLPLARAIKHGEITRDMELWLERQDGEKRILQTSAAPVRDSKGDICAGVVVFSDITERKMTQNALREQASTLRGILSSTPAGILMVIDRKITWASNRFYDLIGYYREELLERNTEILYPDNFEYERVGKELYAQIEKSSIGTLEAKFRDKGGQIFEVLISGMLLDPNSPERGHVFSILDITKNKEAEAMAARNLARFRAIFESTKAGIVLTDLAGNIVQANRAYEAMVGYSGEELCRMNVCDFTNPEDVETTRQVIREFLEGEVSARTFEKRYRRKEGDEINVSVTGSVILDTRGKIENLMAVVIDITEQKNSEAALQAALKEIEGLKERLEAENTYLREEIGEVHGADQILGEDDHFLETMEKVRRVSPTDATVLIIGETGVGKELVARAIHQQSRRKDASMIKVNCASIPRELFESEFFGHVRGSFTGAVADRSGRFELADGGTLFLDEVGEIPLELQSKLLRVLQEGEYERIGEEKTRKVDVRIIAATNRDIEAEVIKGRFRQDLYYRLSVFPVEVPPLRQRPDDIPILADYFLGQISRRIGVQKPELTETHYRQLQGYNWPGNVRELQNLIERAVITSMGDDLVFPLPDAEHLSDKPSARAIKFVSPNAIIKEDQLKEIETANIIAALEKSDWKVSGPAGAAELLGMNASTLYSRIKVLGIKPDDRTEIDDK